MSQTLVDFHTRARTMPLADPEDRALLGSNPSAAVGDGDSDRSNWPTAAPVPRRFFLAALVRKAINPSSFVTVQLGPNRLPNPDRSAIWQYLTELKSGLLLLLTTFKHLSSHQNSPPASSPACADSKCAQRKWAARRTRAKCCRARGLSFAPVHICPFRQSATECPSRE